MYIFLEFIFSLLVSLLLMWGYGLITLKEYTGSSWRYCDDEFQSMFPWCIPTAGVLVCVYVVGSLWKHLTL